MITHVWISCLQMKHYRSVCYTLFCTLNTNVSVAVRTGRCTAWSLGPILMACPSSEGERSFFPYFFCIRSILKSTIFCTISSDQYFRISASAVVLLLQFLLLTTNLVFRGRNWGDSTSTTGVYSGDGLFDFDDDDNNNGSKSIRSGLDSIWMKDVLFGRWLNTPLDEGVEDALFFLDFLEHGHILMDSE